MGVVRNVVVPVAEKLVPKASKEVLPYLGRKAVNMITEGLESAVDTFGKPRKVTSSLYNRPVVKSKPSLAEEISNGNYTPNHMQYNLSPGTRDWITDSDINWDAANTWFDKTRSEVADSILKTGTKKGGDLRIRPRSEVLTEIDNISNEIKKFPLKNLTKAQSELKKQLVRKKNTLTDTLEKHGSVIASGPGMGPDDKLVWGTGKFFPGEAPDALTASQKNMPGYKAQYHAKTHSHHMHMKSLQFEITDQMDQLISEGLATKGDRINLHAMIQSKGLGSSGSWQSSMSFLDRLSHLTGHKFGHPDINIDWMEPSPVPWSNKPVTKTSSKLKVAEWKLFEDSGIKDINRFDIEYAMNWAGKTNNLEFGIAKLKELKSNPRLYKLYGPDGLSEIQRLKVKIRNAKSASEILAIQEEIIETISRPMAENMRHLEAFAQYIGGEELMKYTNNLKGFHEDAAKWYLDQLDEKAFKAEGSMIDLQKQAEEVQRVNKLIYQDRDLYGE